MANPEVRRDSPEADWVRHLQQLLEGALRDAGIQLSQVDGIFGPITEASVIYLQGQNGLPQTGVVDDATWAVLEGAAPSSSPSSSSSSSSSSPSAPTTLRMRPLDLTVPLQLRIDWQDVTLQQLTLDLGKFTVHSTPNTQFRFLTPVGKLFGAGAAWRQRDRGRQPQPQVATDGRHRQHHTVRRRVLEARHLAIAASLAVRPRPAWRPTAAG
jgi:hypothetical protein